MLLWYCCEDWYSIVLLAIIIVCELLLCLLFIDQYYYYYCYWTTIVYWLWYWQYPNWWIVLVLCVCVYVWPSDNGTSQFGVCVMLSVAVVVMTVIANDMWLWANILLVMRNDAMSGVTVTPAIVDWLLCPSEWYWWHYCVCVDQCVVLVTIVYCADWWLDLSYQYYYLLLIWKVLPLLCVCIYYWQWYYWYDPNDIIISNEVTSINDYCVWMIVVWWQCGCGIGQCYCQWSMCIDDPNYWPNGCVCIPLAVARYCGMLTIVCVIDYCWYWLTVLCDSIDDPLLIVVVLTLWTLMMIITMYWQWLFGIVIQWLDIIDQWCIYLLTFNDIIISIIITVLLHCVVLLLLTLLYWKYWLVCYYCVLLYLCSNHVVLLLYYCYCWKQW